MTEMGVLFRLDAGIALGYGHLKRCRTLGEEVERRGGRALFAVGGGEGGQGGQGYERDPETHLVPPDRGPEDEASALAAIAGGPAHLVLDLAHRETARNVGRLHAFLRAARPFFKSISLIDGNGAFALRDRLHPPSGLDLVILPYCGDDAPPNRADFRFLSGGPFVVLDRGCRAPGKREIPPRGRRILVTCGGSDPRGVTLLCVEALGLVTEPGLDIQVVVGPLFDEGYASDVREATWALPHLAAVIEAPESLAAHLAWADLAIALTGLTKYEAAAMGTPAILLSLDAAHSAMHAPFEGFGSSLHLGVAGSVSASELAAAISRLIGDGEERAKQSSRGRALVDGRGAERIMDTILAQVALTA